MLATKLVGFILLQFFCNHIFYLYRFRNGSILKKKKNYEKYFIIHEVLRGLGELCKLR